MLRYKQLPSVIDTDHSDVQTVCTAVQMTYCVLHRLFRETVTGVAARWGITGVQQAATCFQIGPPPSPGITFLDSCTVDVSVNCEDAMTRFVGGVAAWCWSETRT